MSVLQLICLLAFVVIGTFGCHGGGGTTPSRSTGRNGNSGSSGGLGEPGRGSNDHNKKLDALLTASKNFKDLVSREQFRMALQTDQITFDKLIGYSKTVGDKGFQKLLEMIDAKERKLKSDLQKINNHFTNNPSLEVKTYAALEGLVNNLGLDSKDLPDLAIVGRTLEDSKKFISIYNETVKNQ